MFLVQTRLAYNKAEDPDSKRNSLSIQSSMYAYSIQCTTLSNSQVTRKGGHSMAVMYRKG